MTTLSIRPATTDDAASVRRLSLLDSSRELKGEVLIAIVDDEAVAAIEVDSGKAVANPFRLTADVVDVLRLRASRLRGDEAQSHTTRRRRLRSLLPA